MLITTAYSAEKSYGPEWYKNTQLCTTKRISEIEKAAEILGNSTARLPPPTPRDAQQSFNTLEKYKAEINTIKQNEYNKHSLNNALRTIAKAQTALTTFLPSVEDLD